METPPPPLHVSFSDEEPESIEPSIPEQMEDEPDSPRRHKTPYLCHGLCCLVLLMVGSGILLFLLLRGIRQSDQVEPPNWETKPTHCDRNCNGGICIDDLCYVPDNQENECNLDSCPGYCVFQMCYVPVDNSGKYCNEKTCPYGTCKDDICYPKEVVARQTCNKDTCPLGTCEDGVCYHTKPVGCDRDCPGQQCGKLKADPTAEYVCCDHVVKVNVPWNEAHEFICQDLPGGSSCDQYDHLCASNACVHGTCADTKVSAWDGCDSDADCMDQKCARREFDEDSPLVCCPEGDAIRMDVPWNEAHEYVCSRSPIDSKCVDDRSCATNSSCVRGVCQEFQPDFARCDTDSDCATHHCGLAEYNSTEDLICCEQAIRVDDLPWEFNTTWICSRLEPGQRCFQDSNCLSNSCLFGVCSNATLQADDEPCDSGQDCDSHRCGLWYPDKDAPRVCCRGGQAVYQRVEKNGPYETICHRPGHERPLRLPNNHTCTHWHDCESRVCGEYSWQDDSPRVCCDEAIRLWPKTSFWNNNEEDGLYCTHRDNGMRCGDDRVCESGHCIGNVCVPEPQEDGGDCEENSDCVNRVCALSEYSRHATSTCCIDGEAYDLVSDWYFHGELRFCGNLGVGATCGKGGDDDIHDLLCGSGYFCIDGVCQEQALEEGQPCSYDDDCVGRVCAKGDYAANAPTICCPSEGDSTYELDEEDVTMVGRTNSRGGATTTAGAAAIELKAPWLQKSWQTERFCDTVLRPALAPCTMNVQCASGTCAYNQCT